MADVDKRIACECRDHQQPCVDYAHVRVTRHSGERLAVCHRCDYSTDRDVEHLPEFNLQSVSIAEQP